LSSAYLPIAAVMIPELMYEALLAESKKIGLFGHGFTYGGHPVSAAVALKAIEIYARDRVIEKAAKRAPLFQARLKGLGEHPLVGEARGLGLIGGVELVADKASKRSFAPQHGVAAQTVRFAEQEGLIVRSVAGDVLTISPPLVIGAAQIEDLFNRLTRALDKTLDWVTRERLTQA
jgi:4-aminobutyrate--pyruvate transaminase